MGFVKNVGIGIVCASLLGTGAQAAIYMDIGDSGKVEAGESAFDKSAPTLRERNSRGTALSPVEGRPVPEPPVEPKAGPQPEPPTLPARSIDPRAKRPSALGGPQPEPPTRLTVLTPVRRSAARPTSGGAGGCVDPVAESIIVSGVRANGDGTYDFSLRGTVVNRGPAGWVSGTHQQIASLSQGGTVKAVARFPRLTAGARVNTSFARVQRWMPSREFQAGFELRISYDPDIFIDGNEHNDDCQMGNNLISISVAEINRQIARQTP